MAILRFENSGFFLTLFTGRQSEIIQLHPDSTFCDISKKNDGGRYHGRDTSAHGIKS